MGLLAKIAGAARTWLGTYGKFSPSRHVEEIFCSGQVLPELAYYHIGPESAPRAIIALERRLVLRSRFWKPLDVDGQGLRARVERAPVDTVDGRPLSGWRILHPNGETIGMAWSSCKSVVQVKQDGSVVVHPPEPGRRER